MPNDMVTPAMFSGNTFETLFLAFGTIYCYLNAAWFFLFPLSVMDFQGLSFHIAMKGEDLKDERRKGRAKRHPKERKGYCKEDGILSTSCSSPSYLRIAHLLLLTCESRSLAMQTYLPRHCPLLLHTFSHADTSV